MKTIIIALFLLNFGFAIGDARAINPAALSCVMNAGGLQKCLKCIKHDMSAVGSAEITSSCLQTYFEDIGNLEDGALREEMYKLDECLQYGQFSTDCILCVEAVGVFSTDEEIQAFCNYRN